MSELAEKIIKNKNLRDTEVVSLLLDVARNDEDVKLMRTVLQICRKNLAAQHDTKAFYSLYRKALLVAAFYDLDSFLIYLELERPPEERFYVTRRKVLHQAVKAIQALADDKLDELFLSMPPRVGKTTLALFAMAWIMGRRPNASNLYSAYSDFITTAFYAGMNEILTDPNTYLWGNVFPNAHIEATNASLETIDLNRKKRYPTLTCRSLYGTLNGACDCKGFLIADDLIGGIEEALNKDRLDAAWSKVDNNLIPRAKERAKKLWIGTRWSLSDPAGRRMNMLKNRPECSNIRYKIINLPALDENDNSNFDYPFGEGFSSQFYIQRRASFEEQNDSASWLAQYQGEPIERQGVLFNPETTKFYNGTLPDGEPDRIFTFCDVAFGGGDFLSMPIAYQYGDDVYIHDVVFNKSDKKITQPIVAEKIIKNKIGSVRFEYNSGGEGYAEDVDELLKKKGYSCNIQGVYAPTNKKKEIRIWDKAPDIRSFFFRDTTCRDKEYSQFMQNLFSFVVEGKNKHDDAPDSLAGLADMAMTLYMQNVRVLDRWF